MKHSNKKCVEAVRTFLTKENADNVVVVGLLSVTMDEKTRQAEVNFSAVEDSTIVWYGNEIKELGNKVGAAVKVWMDECNQKRIAERN